MKCRYLAYFLGILLFIISCSIQPKIKNISKAGYKDEFSKTFVRFLDSLTYNVSDYSRKHIIQTISLKKYVPDFYIVKVGHLFDTQNNLMLEPYSRKNHYLYYSHMLFLLNVEPQDLTKFHEFDLKKNYQIKIKAKNRKASIGTDEGTYAKCYSLTDSAFMFQHEMYFIDPWDWSIEDDWIDRFRKRIKGELKPSRISDEIEGKKDTIKNKEDFRLSKFTPKEIEELRSLKVYRTYKGKDYTFDEWLKYEKELWEMYKKSSSKID